MRKDATREAILDAFGTLFDRFGYQKTTVDDIARELGLSRAAIYLHFHGKVEIAMAWISRSNREVICRLAEIADSGEPAAERLRSLLLNRVMFRFDRAQKYSLSMDDLFAAIRPALLELRQCNHQEEGGIVVRLIQEAVSDGSITCSCAQGVTDALLTATSGLLPYSLTPKQLGHRDDVENRAIEIIDLMLLGLRTGASAKFVRDRS